MLKKLHNTLIIGLLLLNHTVVQAEEFESYPFYAGFSYGYSQADLDCSYYSDDCDGEGTSFGIYGGKRLYEHLAFEIAYLDLGKLDNERGFETSKAETTGFNFSLLGIIPIDHRYYLYGKAGFMTWDTDYTRKADTTTKISESGTDFTYGLGFAWVLQNIFEFRMEYARLNELDDNFDDNGTHIHNFSFIGNVYFH